MKTLQSIFVTTSIILLTACKTNQLAVVKIDNKYGCINRNGKIVIEPLWDYILIGNINNPILVERDSLYGYINHKGQILIQPKYKDADLFSEGLAAVSNGEKYGYINQKGDTIINFQFDENAWGNFSDDLANVTINEKSGYIDKNGKVIIPLIYEISYPFKSGVGVVMDSLYELKLVTKDGTVLEYNDENIGNKTLLPPRYAYPGSFTTTSGQGRINNLGDTIVPPIYKVTGNLSDNMYIVQNKDNKWGAYNDKGQFTVQCKFDEIWHFNEGLANFKINGKWGFVNKKGEIVIQPIFEYASQFTNGLAYVEINGKSGFINKKGKFAIKPKFQINRGSRFK